MAQIALPLSGVSAEGPEQIVLGEGNRAVADALARPTDWPYGTAVLTGPPRSGKSLFLRWFARTYDSFLADDATKLDESEIFHTWNRAQASARPFLLAVGEGAWDIDLPDLASRIGAALQLRIEPPDDVMTGDLILSHAAQRGLALGDGAVSYLVPRIERSYAAIERIVAAIDRLSLERKAPATMSIWRDALDAVQGPEQGRLL